MKFFRPFCLPIFLIIFFSNSLWSETAPTPRDSYQAARQALDADDPYAALGFLRHALRENPRYADARLAMAEALFLLAEYEEALREIELAKPLMRGRRDIRLLEARLLTALGRYEEAITLYQDLLTEQPHDPKAHRGLAELRAIMGNWELASENYRQSLDYSPGDLRTLLQLVLVYESAQEKDKAEFFLMEALHLFPDTASVLLQATEFYATAQDWEKSLAYLEQAKSLISPENRRHFRRLGLLEAELSLRRGDPAAALGSLKDLPEAGNSDALFLLARAYREMGEEAQAQQQLKTILALNPNDEVARLYREDFLVQTSWGYPDDRLETMLWHLNRGRRFENLFLYDQALAEYRRARLIDKSSIVSWLAYADLIRKKGFLNKYTDVLHAALIDIPVGHSDRVLLEERRELLEHSSVAGLAEKWEMEDPWAIEPAAWTIDLFLMEGRQSLPFHEGAAEALGRYFATHLDRDSKVKVSAASLYTAPSLEMVTSFAEAFRSSRDNSDYFLVIDFVETERSFWAAAELFLSHNGESLVRFDVLRTGQGRVLETLENLAQSLQESIPMRSRILKVEDNLALLDRGRWQGIETEEPWLVLRRGAARPSLAEGGISYPLEAYLGNLEINTISEVFAEASFEKTGSFNFLSPGDEVFLLPAPEALEGSSSIPDAALRSRLLSIP